MTKEQSNAFDHCRKKVSYFILPFLRGRSKCIVSHTTAPLEVMVSQCSVERMISNAGLELYRLQCTVEPGLNGPGCTLFVLYVLHVALF